MKKSNKRRSIATQSIYSLVFLVLAGCTKDTPEPKDDGDFYVRCLLSGEEWESCCAGSECGTWGWKKEYRLDYYESAGDFEFSATRFCEEFDDGLALYADSINIGANKIISRISAFQNRTNLTGCKTYSVDSSYSNTLEIVEIDYNNKIMIGGFEFTAVNECGDTAVVENGDFRIKFRFFP